MGAGYVHSRPLDSAFYGRVAAAAADARWAPSTAIPPAGITVELRGGQLLKVQLEDGPQIVHLDAWSRNDPADRIWPQEISGIEGCFLGAGHRLWSRMPVFRPLLAVVADSLSGPTDADTDGRHHLVLSGWDLPASWAREGGPAGVVTAWERFRNLIAARGSDPNLHRDSISLFQRTRIDSETSVMHRLASCGRTGDSVTLFAEADVVVALVPSPWRDGGRPASECDGTVAGTSAAVAETGLVPLGWPSGGVAYPDISPYLEDHPEKARR